MGFHYTYSSLLSIHYCVFIVNCQASGTVRPSPSFYEWAPCLKAFSWHIWALQSYNLSHSLNHFLSPHLHTVEIIWFGTLPFLLESLQNKYSHHSQRFDTHQDPRLCTFSAVQFVASSQSPIGRDILCSLCTICFKLQSNGGRSVGNFTW